MDIWNQRIEQVSCMILIRLWTLNLMELNLFFNEIVPFQLTTFSTYTCLIIKSVNTAIGWPVRMEEFNSN